jgi:hypothetical protein
MFRYRERHWQMLNLVGLVSTKNALFSGRGWPEASPETLASAA